MATVLPLAARSAMWEVVQSWCGCGLPVKYLNRWDGSLSCTIIIAILFFPLPSGKFFLMRTYSYRDHFTRLSSLDSLAETENLSTPQSSCSLNTFQIVVVFSSLFFTKCLLHSEFSELVSGCHLLPDFLNFMQFKETIFVSTCLRDKHNLRSLSLTGFT